MSLLDVRGCVVLLFEMLEERCMGSLEEDRTKGRPALCHVSPLPSRGWRGLGISAVSLCPAPSPSLCPAPPQIFFSFLPPPPFFFRATPLSAPSALASPSVCKSDSNTTNRENVRLGTQTMRIQIDAITSLCQMSLQGWTTFWFIWEMFWFHPNAPREEAGFRASDVTCSTPRRAHGEDYEEMSSCNWATAELKSAEQLTLRQVWNSQLSLNRRHPANFETTCSQSL